jgi:hypothetical protein
MFEPATNTLVFTEGVGTPGTTVAWAGEDSTLEITNVSLNVSSLDPNSSPLSEPLTGFTLIWSGSSFTFSSLFNTWFSRRTTFVKEEGIVEGNMTYSFNNQVDRPFDLPPSFYAAHRIESPPGSLQLSFIVDGILSPLAPPENGEGGGGGPSGPTQIIWQCTVRSNYDANITGVRYAVEQGEAFKRYEE